MLAHLYFAPPPETPAMVYDFAQVPLDYDDPERGTAAIALIRIAAATQPAPSLLINPGGPGGSGVQTLLTTGPIMAAAFGPNYNIIGFDPRGVNNTTPTIDCFPGAHDKRFIFRSLYFRESSNASSASVATQFANAEAYGHWCNNVIGGTGPNGTARYAGSAAVARDMLTFAEAEQRAQGLPVEEAKVWYYGISYGTVLGTTFASMFPNRVGRMVLDGVMDAEDYYHLQWRSNLADADKVVEKFFSGCYDAGKDKCAFWGPSVEDIRSRFDKVLLALQQRPLPFWNGLDMPRLVTYSDLKAIVLQALYAPLGMFPVLASILHDLENGDGTSLAMLADYNLFPEPELLARIPGDAGSVIPCVDGWGRGNVTSLEAWEEHAAFLGRQSKYVGEAFGHNPLDCATMNVPPPSSASYTGPLPPNGNTSTPILFMSNELDPVTPIRRMSSLFPGSVVLSQDGLGHGIMASPSNCTLQYVQAYFNNGTLPPKDTVCKVNIPTYF
ncbi:hypothetical protein ONZ45_g8045 [Pleurotus djamor]|nr:hypothetical protein ONZ45_g8045 [Pleurotus djamor]